MENQIELPFEGFKTLIRDPLEIHDPRSFEFITSIFLNSAHEVKFNHLSYLLNRLSGKKFAERDSQKHWVHLINHKQDLQAKIGRLVSIQTAASDYFDVIGHPGTYLKATDTTSLSAIPQIANTDTLVNRIYTPGYHLEKLKEEVLRAKRYKHVLSLILLDIDGFHTINEKYSYKAGDETLTVIVKIIHKLIRNVDILSRYSGDRFVLILPNTNMREARELADRLRIAVSKRTAQIAVLKELGGVTTTLSVGQYQPQSTAVEFMKQIERTLESGKQIKRDAIYSL